MAGDPVSPVPPGAAPGGGTIRSLVLRAWLEPGVPPQLRARLVEIAPGRAERPVLVTTSADEACRAVRDWLETLRAQGANDVGDGTVTREDRFRNDAG
jgi:hypothetical protein